MQTLSKVRKVYLRKLAVPLEFEHYAQEPQDFAMRFAEGKEPFPGAGFTFLDDVWDLTYRDTQAVNTRLNFESLPAWLKDPAKEFIAYSCWGKKKSNGTLDNYLFCLKCFNAFMTEYHPGFADVTLLRKEHADGFVQYVINQPQLRQVTKGKYVSPVSLFARFLRKRRPDSTDLAGFHPWIPGGLGPQPTFVQESKVIPQTVQDQIALALAKEEAGLLAAANKDDPNNRKWSQSSPYKRLLYIQVTKLQMLTGRRISHILKIPRHCLREPQAGEARGVWLTWTETKTKQGFQQVFIPSPLDEVAREAIQLARDITKGLIDPTLPWEKQLLFVTPERGKATTHAIPILISAYDYWLNGSFRRRRYPGLLERHNVTHQGKPYYRLKTHAWRHTRSTILRSHGVTLSTIQNDLAHLTIRMTDHYTQAHEQLTKELRQFQRGKHGAVIGNLTAFIAEKDIKVSEYSEQEIDLLNEHGIILVPNRFGGCALPAASGPCPMANPCYIGPKAGEVHSAGCKWFLTSPAFADTITADFAIVMRQYDKHIHSEQSPFFGHVRWLRRTYDQLMEQLNQFHTAGG